MTKLKFLGFVLILAISLHCHAQDYEYRLLPGWKADQVFQAKDGSYDVFGLGATNFKHYLQVNRLDSGLELGLSKSYSSSRQLSETSHLWYSVDSFHHKYYLGVFYDSVNISKVGLLLSVDFDNFEFNTKHVIQLGRRSFPLQTIFTKAGDYQILGVTVSDTIVKDHKPKVFFLRTKNDTVHSVNIYGCNGFSQYQGCELVLRHAIEVDNGLLLVCESRAFQYRDALIDPILIRIDSNGKEIWRRNLGNSITSGLNVLVAPLANGNFLATYVDHYWKPYKDPDGGPNQDSPTPNTNLTMWFTEVTPSGQIDSVWNIREAIKFVGQPYEIAYHNHLIQTKDSSIVIAGSVRDNGQRGFLLNLDKNGRYQWLRHYQLNINGGTEEEELYLYGVTELKQGGYALAGEYRSQPSDSFPTGTQQAVVMFVDEYGCFEPGCQLKDGIPPVQKAKGLSVSLFPNPSDGVFTFKLDGKLRDKKVDYQVYDALGRAILNGEAQNGDNLFIQNPGMYFVYVMAEERVTMVKCAVTE